MRTCVFEHPEQSEITKWDRQSMSKGMNVFLCVCVYASATGFTAICDCKNVCILLRTQEKYNDVFIMFETQKCAQKNLNFFEAISSSPSFYNC